jgi:phosphoribosylformimino-5-aminoimidazole carboxamide ribotide isomerase
MFIIPAVDLQHGRCVRLLRGEFDRETVYGDDPVAMARRWRDAGAELLHVVDLDGAREGRPLQIDVVESIAAVIPVQAGGGLRSVQDLDRVFAAGARRAVLGTGALDPDLIATVVPLYGDRLIVALDTRDGYVAVRGWTERSRWTMLDLARALLAAGVQRFLHTDVERDGTLTSPNFKSLADLIELGARVIASGGVSSVDDLRRLKEAGAEAAIVGRALYEGTVDLQEAMALVG